jgi:hypothetical protein
MIQIIVQMMSRGFGRVRRLAVGKRIRGLPASASILAVLSIVVASTAQARAEEILKYRPIGNNKLLFALAERYFTEEEYEKDKVDYAENYRAKSRAQVIRQVMQFISVDLNRDGRPEIFLLRQLIGWCGSASCEMIVLQQRNGVWKEVYSDSSSDSIKLLDEWDGPYRRVEYNSDLFGKRDILRWDGDHAWGEERDKDGNTVEEYGRYPRPQPTPQE